jgi:hypothetical protein
MMTYHDIHGTLIQAGQRAWHKGEDDGVVYQGTIEVQHVEWSETDQREFDVPAVQEEFVLVYDQPPLCSDDREFAYVSYLLDIIVVGEH